MHMSGAQYASESNTPTIDPSFPRIIIVGCPYWLTFELLLFPLHNYQA